MGGHICRTPGFSGSHRRRKASGVPQSETITPMGNPLGVVAWCRGAAAKNGPNGSEKLRILRQRQAAHQNGPGVEFLVRWFGFKLGEQVHGSRRIIA